VSIDHQSAIPLATRASDCSLHTVTAASKGAARLTNSTRIRAGEARWPQRTECPPSRSVRVDRHGPRWSLSLPKVHGM